MSMYREGYDYYCEMCHKFGLEPINFYYYIQQLTQEQLVAFNDRARQVDVVMQ